jgi:hypothetical protein
MAADINNDGKLISSTRATIPVRPWTNLGNGGCTFQAFQTVPLITGVDGLAPDRNGDGYVDIISIPMDMLVTQQRGWNLKPRTTYRVGTTHVADNRRRNGDGLRDVVRWPTRTTPIRSWSSSNKGGGIR